MATPVDPPAATPAATSPASSSNPLTILSTLDPSKKYTLVFLVSVGTTLLVTGASGGRLLKRAKKTTAAPVTAAPSATETTRKAFNPLARTVAESPRPVVAPIPIPRAPLLPSNTSSAPPTPLFADPSSLTPPRPSLLRSWRLPATTSSPYATSYFLPNAHLLSTSTAFAEALDQADRLHKDGSDPEPEPAEYDGFNPAVYAAKAFGIATVLTVGTFAAGIFGLMKWLGVDDLESLSLALSHSLPSTISSHRPNVPAWALPADSKPAPPPGAEENHPEHKEGMAYWAGVKETLDREAEELKLERRRQWEALVRSRKSGEGRLV